MVTLRCFGRRHFKMLLVFILCYRNFSEQCHNLIQNTYKTSCKYGTGIEEMFQDIANHLVQTNRSKIELRTMDKHSFKITLPAEDTSGEEQCLC